MKLNTKDKGKSGIYVIRNLINNKVYIGKSKNIYIRMKTHVTKLNTKSQDENRHLINAWHKYGKDKFDYYVIEYCEFNESLLKERELYWITIFDSLNRDKGYNLRMDTSTNCEVLEETREKCRRSQIKRYENPEERKKSSEASKKFWNENPEIKERMKKSLSKNRRLYRVGKFDKDTDELIEVFPGIAEVAIKYPDYYIQAIKGCCGGNKKSYKGFKWHYIELNSDNIIKK